MRTALAVALMLPALYVITLGVTLAGIQAVVCYARRTIEVPTEESGWQQWMDDTHEWAVGDQPADGPT